MDELEILKIAHETDPSFTARTYYADILKFAKAIAAAEREACAKLAETPVSGEQDDITMEAKDRVAAAIRERSNAKLTGATPNGGASG
jgi:hypothetical protein